MKVFIAGATGAMGAPTTRLLLKEGHSVSALTRSPKKAAALRDLGVKAFVGDALDGDAVSRALDEARPDGLVNLLTALPQRGPLRFADLDATNRLREEGTRNLMAAAQRTGVKRVVAESIVFVYGYGGHGGKAKTEASPVITSELPEMQRAMEAQLSLERQTLGADGIEGLVLRYGGFYGTGVGSTKFMAKLVKRWMFPLPGGGPGMLPWIHVEDGAAATVSALERGRPGEIYNIVDDDAVTFGDFVRELAAVLGAPKPLSVPHVLGKISKTYASLLMDAGLVVSNEKAKRELGWALQYPTYREGLRSLLVSV
jgi:nucleoside-diphosphate-sugar epimerase